MGYDQSGPVTVNETKSLLVLIALLACIGGGVWLTVQLNKPQEQSQTQPAPVAQQTPAATTRPIPPSVVTSTPPTTRAVATPTQPATLPWYMRPVTEGINRFGPNRMIIKRGPNQIVISLGRSGISVVRTVSREDSSFHDNWIIATAIIRALNDADSADRLGLTLEQTKQLRALELKPLTLTAQQIKTFRDLFEQNQNAQGEQLAAIERALLENANAVAGNQAETDAFNEKMTRARAVLTPEQISDIKEAAAGRRPGRMPATNPSREMP